jgi:hypothetical protein
MRTLQILSILAMALIGSVGTAAQENAMGNQPPAKQSAPSESSDAPGHDAQTGNPKTAEKPNGQGSAKSGANGKITNTPKRPPEK